jgi:hypothetical protein
MFMTLSSNPSMRETEPLSQPYSSHAFLLYDTALGKKLQLKAHTEGIVLCSQPTKWAAVSRRERKRHLGD